METNDLSSMTQINFEIKVPLSGSKTRRENYTCVTPYLVFVILALRSKCAYKKRNTIYIYIYIYMLYDEPKIIAFKVNVYNSNQLKEQEYL